MNYPSVSIEQTTAFSKAWDKSGLKILLDKTSVQFAHDWANIVLKSYVDDMVAKAKAAAKKKAQQEQPQGANTATEAKAAAEPKPTSRIILTD
jgi:hypothetical protein